MKNGQQKTMPRDRGALRSLMHDAITDSHRFWCDRMGQRGIRESSDKSFNEVLDICLDGNCLWTCIYRSSDPHGGAYWEFGATTLDQPNRYIWVLVLPEKAHELFVRYGLEDKNAYL